jgi:UDP-glucoronosyl and UDP-glucosyl transferase
VDRAFDVVVSDGDTTCGLDVARALGLPRVVRVGTLVRDVAVTPFWIPPLGSSLSAHSHPLPKSFLWFGTFAVRLLNAALYVKKNRAHLPSALDVLGGRARESAGLGCAGGGAAWNGSVELGPGEVPGAAWKEVAAEVQMSTAVLEDAEALDSDLALDFDGAPALYMSCQGYDHPRALRPWEQEAGFWTDFCAESAATRLGAATRAWLEDPSQAGVPVVFVSMGTMAPADPAWLHDLVANMLAATDFRFLFATRVVPTALFLPADRIHVEAWVPQVAVLAHESVVAFVTHGGANSVGDTIFAQRPTVCIPHFLDQFTNCRRLEDNDLGVYVDRRSLTDTPLALAGALHAVLQNPRTPPALQRAWAGVVASDGLRKLVLTVEDAARAGLRHFRDPVRPWRTTDRRKEWTGYAGLAYAIGILVGIFFASATLFFLATHRTRFCLCSLLLLLILSWPLLPLIHSAIFWYKLR